MFNRYSFSILSVTFLVLIGSEAINAKPYVYCNGEVKDVRDNTTNIVLKVIAQPGSDLIQEGKAYLTLCNRGDLPALNSDQLMVLPHLDSGKPGVVFHSFREESLEIVRWVKKDAFEAVYDSPEKISDSPDSTSIKMSCKVSRSFPKDICSPKANR